jgi:AAA ATPase domain
VVSGFGTGRSDSATGCVAWHDGDSSMYLSLETIQEALAGLAQVHPFFGVTFLVCKQAELPVGETKPFPLQSAEMDFIERYYKPNPNSAYCYRAFGAPDETRWLTTSDWANHGGWKFQPAFNSAEDHIDSWGWESDYVQRLKNLGSQIPATRLASWLYRDRELPEDTTDAHLAQLLSEEFRITQEERSLFDWPQGREQLSLRSAPVTWAELRKTIGDPPDDRQEFPPVLAALELRAIGPASVLSFEPGPRLNVITRDNGLGKTFLVDAAWWALTGDWAGAQAIPRESVKRSEPSIRFLIRTEAEKGSHRVSFYNWSSQRWHYQGPSHSGLALYVRADGSFSVWNSAKAPPGPLNLTRTQVWNGLEGGNGSTAIINGLVRDWVIWQTSSDREPFETFRLVLKRLSPPDLGEFEPDRPMRLPGDAREFPTVRHSYGRVPVIHTSAGVQRILSLAYMIVWSWHEHKISSELARKAPQRGMIVLLDEIEAHLHPKWQRVILPALLDVANHLGSDLRIQFIVGTHSPLVLASLEPCFDEKQDKLFHLGLTNGEVTLGELPWIRHGPVDAWLTSEVFELAQARSKEAESAILEAQRLQGEPNPRSEDVKAGFQQAGSISR